MSLRCGIIKIMPRTAISPLKENRLSIRANEQESRIAVSPEDYDWLCHVMDQPAAPAPRLRAALAQTPVWDV